MKTLRWLIVLVGAAIVAYLLLSSPGRRADRNTRIVVDPAVADPREAAARTARAAV